MKMFISNFVSLLFLIISICCITELMSFGNNTYIIGCNLWIFGKNNKRHKIMCIMNITLWKHHNPVRLRNYYITMDEICEKTLQKIIRY